MRDGISVEQRAGIGSQTTQIGNQNNYYGLSPQEACNMTMQLFYDNFPKLQEAANEVVRERVNELMGEIAQKIEERKLGDMSPFGDPDVQYAVYEAQKNYARFGTKEMMSSLSELVAHRIQHNDEGCCLKVTIDKAIELVPSLTPGQLDLLSLFFWCYKVGLPLIRDLNELKAHLDALSSIFKNADFNSVSYLNMLGCLELCINDPVVCYSKRYGFPKEDIESICPEMIRKTAGSYTTSYVGTILAIVNSESKINTKIDPCTWIY